MTLSEQSVWIVAWSTCETFPTTTAAVVEAPDAPTAAALGAELLQQDEDERQENGGTGEEVRSVFVAPFDGREAFTCERSFRVERAALQCCAGGPHAEFIGCEGHYATCRDRPEGTGQERR